MSRETAVYCTQDGCDHIGHVSDGPAFDEVVNDYGEALCAPCAAAGKQPERGRVTPFPYGGQS